MIKMAIEHKKIVFYALCLILIGGIFSYTVLPKQEAPDLSPPVAIITAIYPGASQGDVEKFVTEKIEENIMEIEAYDYSYSYTYNSIATIIVYMKYGNDTDELWNELRRELGDLQDALPDEVLKLKVDTNLADTAGMLISLTGEDYSYDSLSFYGNRISDELKTIDGISRFEMLGEVGKEVEINVDAGEMNRLDISYEELSRLLKGQNLEIPSGTVHTENEDVPLIIKGSFDSLVDIENIILDVSRDNFSVLRLKDIATIQFVDEDASRVFYRDGKKSVLLVGYFEENRNVLDVGRDVRDRIETIQKSIPEKLQFEEVVFQPKEVDRALGSFLINLLMGIGLVIVVVFIGMGLRNAIVVSFAIPTSILTTLVFMPLFNIKIHAISITAFIVALGMLVDNAIVVSDSIQNRLDAGEKRMEACIGGTKEVIISILTSTLTTVAAFSPLIMLDSIAGDYVKSLPQVVILALIASFFFAFLVTPTLAYVFF